MQSGVPRFVKHLVATAIMLFGLGVSVTGAQEVQPSPTLPSPTIPIAATSEAPPVSREAAMEQRLQKLEDDNRRILQLYEGMAKQNAELSRQLGASSSSTSPSRAAEAPPGAGGATTREPTADQSVESNREGRISSPSQRGVGAQGTISRAFEPQSTFRGNEKVPRRKAIVEFAEGLEFKSDDDEFKLQFHNLTQVELRAFPQNQTGPLPSNLHTGFFVPRERWYFTGRVTKNIEYYTATNRGYGTFDLLDAFLTFRYDERLRLRVGRMKTPYLYEYYQIAEGDLVAPERSIYAGNVATNRQVGAMVLGELFKSRLDYAAAVFNGGRPSYEDTNNSKDLFLFLNARPFFNPARSTPDPGFLGRGRPNQGFGGGSGASGDEPIGPFEYFNIGGSVNAGYDQNPAAPGVFRTANDQTTATAAGSLSPTFLAFNPGTISNGERMQWSAHIAWYYRSVFLLAEYGGGFETYAGPKSPQTTRVGLEGYMAQASWFVTGEQITRRVNVVKPLKDFRIRDGRISGPGAVEVYARYSFMNIGKDIFTAGLANPNLWSNQAQATDIGANWYLNFYTKIYLDWQHAQFGDPVMVRPGGFSRTTDLFWLRFQLFF